MVIEIFTPAMIFLSGISAYSAIQHLTLEQRWPQRRVHLLFSCICFLITLFVLSYVNIFKMTTVNEINSALRLNLVFYILLTALLPWFFAEYTGVRPKPVLIGFSVLFAVLFILNLTQPYTVLYTDIHGIKNLTLPWGESLSFPLASSGIFGLIGMVSTYLANIFGFYTLVIRFRKDHRITALFMMAAIGLLVAGTITGMLFRMEIGNIPPMGPIGYIGMIIIMGLTLSHEIQEDRRHLQEILDHVPAHIYIKNTEGRYIMINRHFEDMFNVSNATIKGKTDYDIFSKEQADAFLVNDKRLFSTRQPLSSEEIVTSNGESRAYLSVKFPLFHADGTIYGLCGISTDISDIKKAEESQQRLQNQLAQAQKMESIGTLAGGIAHDFNNILTPIMGYTELALLAIGDKNPAAGDLILVMESANLGSELTRQILAFSRKQILEMKILDLNHEVHSIERMLKRIIGEDISIVLGLDDDICSIKGDPTQLQQVLLNLMINARDAMPDGGSVTIETSNIELDNTEVWLIREIPPGRYVVLSITDTGSGMDKETAQRIFEPFFTTKDVEKGTGLGLSIVYGIVRQHGGEINVYSEIGHGTTFQIYLPCANGETETAVEKDREYSMGGNETILLVEDNKPVNDLVQRILRSEGYTVFSASGSKEALEIASIYGEKINLLLTDVVMPGLKGPEIYDKLKSKHTGIKVLYMSGYPGSSGVLKDFFIKGERILRKPFTIKVLASAVRNALEFKI